MAEFPALKLTGAPADVSGDPLQVKMLNKQMTLEAHHTGTGSYPSFELELESKRPLNNVKIDAAFLSCSSGTPIAPSIFPP